MKELSIKGKRFIPYISHQEIEEKVSEMASRIAVDYKDDCPLLLVVLNGAMVFASSLMQKMNIPLEICCIRYNSYVNMQTSEQVKEVIGLPEERLKGRRVIVVEDIVDTGNTIAYLFGKLEACGVADAKVATLTFKQGKYKASQPISYVGFPIADDFIVGYGMDYDEQGRQYPDIYQYSAF